MFRRGREIFLTGILFFLNISKRKVFCLRLKRFLLGPKKRSSDGRIVMYKQRVALVFQLSSSLIYRPAFDSRRVIDINGDLVHKKLWKYCTAFLPLLGSISQVHIHRAWFGRERDYTGRTIASRRYQPLCKTRRITAGCHCRVRVAIIIPAAEGSTPNFVTIFGTQTRYPHRR